MAASVRIESEAFSDPRVELLGTLAGYNRYEALGRLAHLWMVCTHRESYELPEVNVLACMGERGVDALIGSGLGERTTAGVRVKGTHGRIEWLKKRREASRAGGEAKRTQSQPKAKPNGSQTVAKRHGTVNGPTDGAGAAGGDLGSQTGAKGKPNGSQTGAKTDPDGSQEQPAGEPNATQSEAKSDSSRVLSGSGDGKPNGSQTGAKGKPNPTPVFSSSSLSKEQIPIAAQSGGGGRPASKKKRTKGEPNPDHQPSIARFCEAWAAKYGAKYPFNHGKDASAISWMLEQAGSGARFAECVARYFACDDPFIVEHRHGTGTMRSQFQRWIVAAATTTPTPKETIYDRMQRIADEENARIKENQTCPISPPPVPNGLFDGPETTPPPSAPPKT
jgi:hypothetical protein